MNMKYRDEFRNKAKVRLGCGDYCQVNPSILCPLPQHLSAKTIKNGTHVCTTGFEEEGIV